MNKLLNIKNSYKTGVLIVGGGTAGVAAALSVAEFEGEAIILEKYCHLGGQASLGLLDTVCGLPHSVGNEVHDLPSSRFARKFLDKLAKSSSTKIESIIDRQNNRLTFLPYLSEKYAELAQEQLQKHKGITILTQSSLLSIRQDKQLAHQAKVRVRNQEVTISFKSLLDCTGEATAVYMAGGETILPVRDQSPGFLFKVKNVHADLFQLNTRLSLRRAIVKAVADGLLPPECRSLSITPGSEYLDDFTFKLALKPLSPDNGYVRQHLEVPRVVTELIKFFASEIKGFETAQLGQVSTFVGVRIGRRARGLYCLTREDVLSGRSFTDGVVRGTWPIEVWDNEISPRIEQIKSDCGYEIPLRSLRCRQLKNVWVSGRCISADDEALASARVIGTSIATGWAAGVAAACQANKVPDAQMMEFLRGKGS